MKTYTVIILLLFTWAVHGQKKHTDINGDWLNVKLRECILGDSIEREDVNQLLPMYITIKNKNKIAFFYQAEPSDLKYEKLKKKNDTIYLLKDKVLTFSDSLLFLKSNNNTLKFIKKRADNFREMFDVNTELTENFINYKKIGSIIDLENNQKLSLTCQPESKYISCLSSKLKFDYEIMSSYPSYSHSNKTFDKLYYYMSINKGNLSTKVYLIKKQEKILVLYNMIENKYDYYILMEN